MNEIGRPLTRPNRTAFQSASVVFSTIAQPLDERFLLRIEKKAVSCFPDGCFLDVADSDFALASSQEVESDRFFVRRIASRQHCERLAEFGVEIGVDELDVANVVEGNATETIVSEQVQVFDFGHLRIGLVALFLFDADDRALNSIGRFNFDFFAAKLHQELTKRRRSVRSIAKDLSVLVIGSRDP